MAVLCFICGSVEVCSFYKHRFLCNACFGKHALPEIKREELEPKVKFKPKKSIWF